jgi:hypothetical protein
VITGGDPQPRMPVDNAAVVARNRNVGEQTANEAGTDCDAAHGTHHRLTAIDHVVDDVARLLPLPRAGAEVVDILLDDREVAAGREHLAGAGQDHGIDAGIPIDIAPDVAQFGM